MLNNNYTFWFHKVNDDKWGIDSYSKLSKVETMDDLLFFLKKVNNFNSGMFFFFKNDIFPIYEDKSNIKGGVWSFKISKKYSNDFWKNMCYYFCNEKLTNKKEDSKYITGLSISPKINNCILKIWVSEKVENKIFKNDIEYLELGEGLYRKHK